MESDAETVCGGGPVTLTCEVIDVDCKSRKSKQWVTFVDGNYVGVYIVFLKNFPFSASPKNRGPPTCTPKM